MSERHYDVVAREATQGRSRWTNEQAAEFYDNNFSVLNDLALIEASKGGASIETSDPRALEEARWREAHFMQDDVDGLDMIRQFNIAELTPEDIEKNAANYPELRMEFSDDELQKARELVNQLSLFHTVRNNDFARYIQAGSGRLLPLAQNESEGTEHDHHGYAQELDRALGLDNYVFLTFGTPYDHQTLDETEKGAVLEVDAKLLFDERCIVTPQDISHASPDLFVSGSVSRQEDIDSVRAYSDSVVSGKVWHEIITRRLVSWRRTHTDKPLPLMLFALGEVKFRGEITAEAVKSVLFTDEDMAQYYRAMPPAFAAPM